jgi:signal transduction histidine kinase
LEGTDRPVAPAHARFVATARRLRPEAGPDELLRTVAGGMFDLDDADQVSLHLAAGDGTQVVAVVPPSRPRTTSPAVRRAVEREQVVREDEAGARVVAVPLVLEGRTCGALAVRRPRGRPLPADDEAELATVLLASAVSTVRWLDGQRELDRARANFVARVSHELRTPLTIISGFATTLGALDDTLSEADRHRMLDRIVTASVRLEHLVEEVLTLASVELGHTQPAPVRCSVRDVVDLVVNDKNGGGRCQVACADDLRISTDPVVARLVIGPVVENALQHGERVEVAAHPHDGGVRIVVRDDGPGIPAELGDAVFERFVRGDDRAPGFGLGLSTAREVGALIGARLSLAEVPSGTAVVIDLPDLATTT